MLARAPVDRIVSWMVRLLDELPSELRSLALGRLDFLEHGSFRRRFVLHVNQVVGRAAVTFHADLVLLPHPLVATFLVRVHLLHVLPATNVSLHLGLTPGFDE